MFAINKLELFEATWYTFVAPIICIVSFILNIVNVNVLDRMKQANKIYYYMYIKSIVNSIYLLISIFVFMIKCGQFCDIDNTYFSKLYHLYFFIYLISCLGLFDLFIEISISLNRFFTITNKHFQNHHIKNNFNSNMILLFLLFYSFLFHSPYLFAYQINEIKVYNDTYSIFVNKLKEIKIINYTAKYNKYEMVFNDNYKIRFELINYIGVVLRSFLMFFLIVLVNILGLYKFKQNVNNLLVMRTIHGNRSSLFYSMNLVVYSDLNYCNKKLNFLLLEIYLQPMLFESLKHRPSSYQMR
jgi:hypothetical protein